MGDGQEKVCGSWCPGEKSRWALEEKHKLETEAHWGLVLPCTTLAICYKRYTELFVSLSSSDQFLHLPSRNYQQPSLPSTMYLSQLIQQYKNETAKGYGRKGGCQTSAASACELLELWQSVETSADLICRSGLTKRGTAVFAGGGGGHTNSCCDSTMFRPEIQIHCLSVKNTSLKKTSSVPWFTVVFSNMFQYKEKRE